MRALDTLHAPFFALEQFVELDHKGKETLMFFLGDNLLAESVQFRFFFWIHYVYSEIVHSAGVALSQTATVAASAGPWRLVVQGPSETFHSRGAASASLTTSSSW